MSGSEAGGDGPPPGELPPWPAPILQLHTSHHCNLACLHCYSSSGPRRKGGLDASTVAKLLEDSAELGYGILSLSGGEPLMDPALDSHLETARRLGFQVDLVSNGTLIDRRAAERLAERSDLVAISIDGPPALHDSLRGLPGAFERAVAGLRFLVAAGVRVGIIHTVRPETLAHLRWLIGFAREEGVGLVQLHPIESVGRASRRMKAGLEGELETRLAMLVALIGEEDRGGVYVHCDILGVEALAAPAGESCGALPRELGFSEIIDPLVVEPDGSVVPWVYGIDRSLALGRLDEAPLSALAPLYWKTKLAAALAHREAVAACLAECHRWPFVNWYAALSTRPVGFERPVPPAGSPPVLPDPPTQQSIVLVQ